MNVSKIKIKHVAFGVLVVLSLLTVLSACSGMVGGATSVRMTVGNAGSGRYIHEGVNEGYVAVLQKNKIHSINEFEYDSEARYEEFDNGSVYLNSIAPGKYIFIVVLLERNGGATFNRGLAIKEVTVNKGFNDLYIEVGPGVGSFYIDQTNVTDVPLFELISPGGEYLNLISFKEDTVVFKKSGLQKLPGAGTEITLNDVRLAFQWDMDNGLDPLPPPVGAGQRSDAEENEETGIVRFRPESTYPLSQSGERYFLNIQLAD